jgi:long-chain acyl-CoA synthetase
MTTLTQTHTQLKSPLAMLYHWESSQPQHPYLHQPISGQWHVWTWGQFGEEVRRMAAAIQAKGYEPGSRIGILSRNCAHWMMADLAIMMSGHVSVPIYPNVKAATVEYILQHSEAKLLFVGKLEQHDWDEMKAGIPASVECISFGIYGLSGADYPAWNEVTKVHAPLEGSPERDLQDIMTIIYTSGTTGLPKGVVHRFISPVFAIEKFVSFFSLTPSDRFFSYLPLSHIAERMLITMGTLRTGGSIHFAQSLDTFTDNLKTCKPTVFLGVPRIWTKFQMGVLAKFPPSRLNLLLAIPGVGGFIRKKIKEALGLDHARVTLSGAAAMPVALLEWYYKLGVLIYEVYGMTENSAYSHANVPGAYKFGTVGKTLPDCQTKITEEGEICLRCITNLVEYYKEPDKTAESLRDGWLHTGDKGVEDAQGFLRITGRVKDLFKTSKAKYVAPSPIEMKFASNDLIEQICVVGTNLPQPIALAVLSADARNRNRDEVSKSVQDTLFAVNATLEDHEVLEKVVLMKEEWTVENGILTPSLKIKRGAVDDKFMKHYEKWYAGGRGVIWE